jgi:hypothetical protein
MRVRDYILQQTKAIGLIAAVEKGVSVENVVARLPGTASSRDVLITAHYDSHPPSPGAGDDGISVAAMLETMRALQAGPPLRNDIVFLFTDGEELGWLGAAAFVAAHPNAHDQTGVVLCFDGRPGNGSLNLSSTSPGDAWLIRQLAAAHPPLDANSRRNAEERSDSDTDCTSVFGPAGFQGFEFENEARGPRYHLPTDTADAISPGIVQAFGDSMTRLARRFGDLNLASVLPTHDDTYFTVPHAGVVVYPRWVTPVVAVAGLLGFVVLVMLASLKRGVSLPLTALAALARLGALLLITALASLVWVKLLASAAVTYDLGTHDPYFEGISLAMATIVGVSIFLGLASLYALSRWRDEVSLTVSGLIVFLLVWWLAYFFLDADNPLDYPPLAWGLAAGVAGLAVLMFVRHPVLKPVLLFLAAVPIFVLAVPTLIPDILQPNGDGAWVPVLSIGLLLGVLVPQFAFILGFAAPPTPSKVGSRASLPAA